MNNLDKNIIQKELTNKLGEKLKVDYIVNNKIIAGLIIKIGSKMIDSSLLTKINKLKLLMKET